MIETKLAKIESAKFGVIDDYPFLWGMTLTFSGNGWGVADGGRYMINMSENCKWPRQEFLEALEKANRFAFDTITQAKVRSVEELKGIPVEVTLDRNQFASFRILTEVL